MLTPVFPPIAASTIPTSVVDTCTTGTPRCQEAAAKPATSVTIPPPTPTTTSLRVSPMRAKPRLNVSMVASDLCSSPCPISNTSNGTPGSIVTGMPAWVTMAARAAERGSSAASSDTTPWPTTTS